MPDLQERYVYPWLKVDEEDNSWCIACIHFSALAPGDKLFDPNLQDKNI